MNSEWKNGSYWILQLQEHALTVAVISITLVLIYYYIIDRGRGLKLSRRYRHSIFELQSKLFLNASQYLIAGQKDLAIQELLNAADVHKETLDAYFALGKLYRSSGEIEKAVAIHRSMIAKETISESVRLQALTELAIDYDKAGLIDKAIDTYKDVLKLNREQVDVIKNLCRIFEDIADWDQALNFRLMLSKMSSENQSDTLSHILVEQSKNLLDRGKISESSEKLDEAFRYAPSVSARIQRIKLLLVVGDLEQAKVWLIELLKEYPLYASFIFVTLEKVVGSAEFKEAYQKRYLYLKEFFLQIKDSELLADPSVLLSKVRLLKIASHKDQALALIEEWKNQKNPIQGDSMKMEYIQLLIELGRKDEALQETQKFLASLQGSSTRHFCSQCGFNSDEIFWRCPQCHQWETIQFRWKL